MLASCTDEQIEASTRPEDFFCTREAQWSAGNPVSLKLGLQAALNTQLHSFFFLLLALCDVGEKGYN